MLGCGGYEDLPLSTLLRTSEEFLTSTFAEQR